MKTHGKSLYDAEISGQGRYMKICFIASSGGHWEEVMCLKKIAEENNTFYITETGGQTVNSGSLTGRLVYPFADLFLVQWKALQQIYPKAIYVGGIF